jgi:RNA polymerase sigma-70 factor (ECF subfamily)
MTSPLPTPPVADDESALARRARDGDVQAFEALYRRTAGRVFALCLRMTHDRERARELAHDAFVLAWQKLPTFREEAAFTTWLHRLTVNLVLQRLRGERRRAAHELPEAALDDEVGSPGEGRAILQLVRHDEASRIDLETAIARLPPNARLVFVLHEIEGYRHEEIARSMGIAEGTVRAHLHRARRLLMEYLS